MPVKTPNNFFAEDRYGPVTGTISDATTFAQLGSEHQGRMDASIDATAQTVAKPERQKMSRARKAVGAALLTATVLAVPQVREGMGSAASAVVERVGRDRVFHPEQGNPSPDQMPSTQPETPPNKATQTFPVSK